MAGLNQHAPDSEVLIFRQNSQGSQRQRLHIANAYFGKHDMTDDSISRFSDKRQLFHILGAPPQTANQIMFVSISMLRSRESRFYDFSNRISVSFPFHPHINHFVHITINIFLFRDKRLINKFRFIFDKISQIPQTFG